MSPFSFLHALLLSWHYRSFVKTLLGCMAALTFLLFIGHLAAGGFASQPKDWEFQAVAGGSFLLALALHRRRQPEP
ncbi:MAG: hypothetical protein HY927_06680 [Elusimicrobia bacterium]|nr:hypothetical protein [Elusimicrobiota bacterium]